ncbi:MAG: DoxX family protein [Vicinamibacterales bacterium]
MEILFLLGRVLLGGFFVISGIRHFQHLDMMAGFVASKRLPAAKLLVSASGLLIIFGGLSILLGLRPFFGVAAITLFLIPVTFWMHAYWDDKDPMMRINNQVNFMKNVALLGAAWMLLAIPRPWPMSLGL